MRRYPIPIHQRPPKSLTKAELLKGILMALILLIVFGAYVIGAIWEV